jgi:hypothetical protein
MKSINNILSVAALSGMLMLAMPCAYAQHDHSSGGGGGGSHAVSSGGGAHFSAPAVSRPSFSQPSRQNSSSSHIISQPRTNVQRPTIGRPNFAPQRSNGTYTTSQYQGHSVGGATRIGVTQTYRTYQGSTYGHNYIGGHGFLPGNTYYHYNHGYYGTYYRPRLGFTIGVLPYGYYPFYFGDYEYFYSDGLFYQYDNDQYTVVEPPVGAEITSLPSDAQSIVINGQQFYEAEGVYYKPVTKDDGTLVYEVAGKDGELNTGDDDGTDVNAAPQAPQIGDIVAQLPQGCRRLRVNGQMLYLSPDGIYYQQQVEQDGTTDYKIVGLPDDNGDDQQQQ